MNGAFTPNQADVAWARRIMDAFAANPRLGVLRIDGKMIDKPHLRAAEKTLAAPERGKGDPPRSCRNETSMIVRQASNVLDLLEFFAQERRPATLSEIADHFGWPRSSTFNLLTTLAERGYLYEPKPRAGYYPTPRWLTQSQIVANAEPLPPWTKLILAELAADTGETVALGGAAGTKAVFLDVVESSASIRYFGHVGHRIPIHASSTGRAILVQYTLEERLALYRKIEFKEFGPRTPMSIDMVEAELRRSIERGYCVSFADFSPDLAGVAMRLGLPERRLSVVVAGPIFRLEHRIEQVASATKQAIERHLSHAANQTLVAAARS